MHTVDIVTFQYNKKTSNRIFITCIARDLIGFFYQFDDHLLHIEDAHSLTESSFSSFKTSNSEEYWK